MNHLCEVSQTLVDCDMNFHVILDLAEITDMPVWNNFGYGMSWSWVANMSLLVKWDGYLTSCDL